MFDDVTIFEGDCRHVFHDIETCSIHMVLTDPPYFLDRLNDDWDKDAIEESQKKARVVGGLPVGMKFDVTQGHKLQKFLFPICKELFRVLVPGGFLLMFSSPRLSHRAAIAIEDSKFEIRDMFAWHFTKKSQFKAFSMNHFIQRRRGLHDDEKKHMISMMSNRKTPQLRPQFETILCAQKPRKGTFLDNWLHYGTGLIDASQSIHGKGVPTTLMKVEKEERGKYNSHLTPKPIALCKHLIKLFTQEGQIVLDPFLGSGSTLIAAHQAGRKSIGIEIDKKYIHIARSRIEKMS